MKAGNSGRRAGRVAALVAGVLALFAVTGPAASQDPAAETLSGRVMLGGEGMPGVEIALHRVTPDSSGVQESARSGPGGTFSFDLPRPDTAGFTVYFVTADYHDVRYFGAPVHPGDSPEDYRVAVRDTTSAAGESLRLSRRDLVLLPHADGGWEVNEVVRLRNTGELTIVSRSEMPTWQMDLPAGIEEFEAGAGEIPGDQLTRMGDRLLLLAPIIPGDREIFLRYRIPPGSEAELATGTAMDSVNLFLQQPAPHLTVTGMEPVEIVTVEGRRFLQMSAATVGGDEPLLMEWESSAPPVDPVWAGVGAALLVMLVGAGAAFRGRAA